MLGLRRLAESPTFKVMSVGVRRQGPGLGSSPGVILLAGLASTTLGSCNGNSERCALPPPTALATAPVGDLGEGRYKYVNGRIVSPVGRHLEVGTFPLNLALAPGGKLLAATHGGESDRKLQNPEHQSVWIIDPDGPRALQTIETEALFFGLVFSPDGRRLYASAGGGNAVKVYDASVSPMTETFSITLPDYPSGLAVTLDGTLLLVARLHEHTLSIFRTDTFEKVADIPTQAYPYAVAVRPDGRRAFVSNWGDGSLTAVDLAAQASLGRVAVGKNPEGLAISPDGRLVAVANSDDDSVTILDSDALTAVATISLKSGAHQPPGVMPVDVTFSPDGRRLFVACSGENALAVLEVETAAVKGRIPTGSYPTSVRTDGNRLFVLSGKGIGARPNLQNEFITGLAWGHVATLSVPSDGELADYTRRVEENNNPMKGYYNLGPECTDVRGPVPISENSPSGSIRHVVYIIRENKTYDSLLGDLGGDTRGEPSFALFGEKITPNLHALARRYANLDNCYYESEQSLQGHIWISGGWSNDFSERNWAAMWSQKGVGQIFLPSAEPAARGSDTLLYDNFVRHNVPFRVYGDPVGILSDLLGTFRNSIDFRYPTWSLQVRDADKVLEFVRELELGVFPSFVSIWVPNDHTRGTSAGAPTPETMVADNDHGTGLIIEALSRSPFWNETVVFLFEDDPQGTPDHVDAHRGPCLVIGPHVKRGFVSHVHYSFPSFHRTMELILGLPPISQFDARAVPILDVFDAEPRNTEPFSAVAPDLPVRYNAPSAYGAEESARMDFSAPDQAPGLGRILWHAVKGTHVPYPEEMAAEEDDED